MRTFYYLCNIKLKIILTIKQLKNMGYTTEFSGSFKFDRPLTEIEKNYINNLAETRRVKRDSSKLMEKYKGKLGNPFAKNDTVEEIYGIDGEYFVDNDEYDETIIDYNTPPKSQPGLWCQWIVSGDNDCLEWDCGEKFYNYINWLQYLIDHFFSKWGVNLNGEVIWNGEDSEDVGKMVVENNNVLLKYMVWQD